MTFLYFAVAVALLADWMQTLYIAKHPDRFYERNPILGKHPSVRRVNIYFTAASAVIVLIAVVLDGFWRTGFLVAVLAVELACVIHNHRNGVRFT